MPARRRLPLLATALGAGLVTLAPAPLGAAPALPRDPDADPVTEPVTTARAPERDPDPGPVREPEPAAVRSGRTGDAPETTDAAPRRRRSATGAPDSPRSGLPVDPESAPSAAGSPVGSPDSSPAGSGPAEPAPASGTGPAPPAAALPSTTDDRGEADAAPHTGRGPLDRGHHEVRAGESLWSIAADQLAAATGRSPDDLGPGPVAGYWVRLCDANRDRLVSGDLDLVHPGELLVLPPA